MSAMRPDTVTFVTNPLEQVFSPGGRVAMYGQIPHMAVIPCDRNIVLILVRLLTGYWLLHRKLHDGRAQSLNLLGC